MRFVLLTVLLVLLASPAADGKSRLLAEPDGTVTIEWTNRVCTPSDLDSEPVTFSPTDALDFDSPAVTDTAIDDVELDAVRPDDSADAPELLYPEFPLRPWRVEYRADGSYATSYDLTCASDDVLVDPLDPDARTLMRAARASHRAKVKAARDKARRRGLGR